MSNALPTPPARTDLRVRPTDLLAPVGSRVVRILGAAACPEVVLQNDDLLCIGARGDGTGLILLEPTTLGYPMLGRRQRHRLVAAPSNVPADPARWSVAGEVVALWRRDLRNATLSLQSAPHPGTGAAPRWIAVRIGRPTQALAALSDARVLGRVSERTDADAAHLLSQAGRTLAGRLHAAMGESMRVVRADASDLLVSARLPVSPSDVGALARTLAGAAGVPIALAIADQEACAIEGAGRAGANELLFVLPGHRIAQAERPPRRSDVEPGSTRLGLPEGTVSRSLQAPPHGTLPHSRPARPSPPRQLSLFGDVKAA